MRSALALTALVLPLLGLSNGAGASDLARACLDECRASGAETSYCVAYCDCSDKELNRGRTREDIHQLLEAARGGGKAARSAKAIMSTVGVRCADEVSRR